MRTFSRLRFILLMLAFSLTLEAADWGVSYKFEPTLIPGFPPEHDWNDAERWQPEICTQRNAVGGCTNKTYPGGGVPIDATETVFWQVNLTNNDPLGAAKLNLGVSASPIGSLTLNDGVIFRVGGILGMNQQKWDQGSGWIWQRAKLTNDGAIDHFGTISSNGGDLVLEGSGTLTMNGGSIEVPDNPTLANDPGLINRSTIVGFGEIRATAGFHNEGLTKASSAIAPLLIRYYQAPFRPGSNRGTLRAAGGGTLRLVGNTAGTPLDNDTGLIEALDGSRIGLENISIRKGSLSTSGSGVVEVRTYDVGIADVVSNGLLEVASGQRLLLERGETGVITNNGTIRLITTGFETTLVAPWGAAGSAVQLAGNGALELTHDTRTLVEGGNHLLNGPDHTIRGRGTIRNNRFVTNQGLIDADVAGGRLRVQPQINGQLFNTGLMRATGGGTLEVSAPDFFNFSNVDNTGGTVFAGDGSLVEVKFVKVLGGTFDTAGSGVIRTLSGGGVQLGGVSNLGLLDLQSGSLLLDGIITNHGQMTLGIGAAGQSLDVAVNATTTLGGGGTLVLSNSAANQIRSAGGIATTIVNGTGHTIRGAGGIGTTGLLNVVNDGLVLADEAMPLHVAQSALFTNLTNNGTLRAADASTLAVGGKLNNFDTASRTLTGGTYHAAGTMRLPVAGGILNNAAEIVLDGPGSQLYNGAAGTDEALASFAVNQAAGRFELRGGRDFATAGDFTNAGNVRIGVGSLMATTNAGIYYQTGGGTVVEGVLSAPGGMILAGGTLGGTGSIIGSLVNVGTLAPGSSFGTLSVTGDYTQGAGKLQVEIGATDADVLVVSGVAELGGTLEVLLAGGGPGAAPAIGTSFDILKAASIIGKFDTLALPYLGGLSLNIEYLTDAVGAIDVVRLSVAAVVVPAPAAALLLLTGVGTLLTGMRRRHAR